MRKTLLFLVLVGLFAFGISHKTNAYTEGRVASNGNLKKWDLTNTTRPNINADGNIIIDFNSAGCADYKDFTGLIDEFQAFLNAMNKWNEFEYCKAKLVFGGKTTSGKDGNDDKNVLFFDNKGTISPGVYGLSTVTYNSNTGEILDADIGFNDTSFAWDTLGKGTSGVSNKTYIEAIATHELGHSLGLGHTFMKSAVMSPSAYVGEISQYFPTLDDEVGLSALYPESSFSADFSALGGIATKNFTPVFGAGFVLVDLRDFMPKVNVLSQNTGVYALAGVDPGRYWVLSFPADKGVLSDYHDTIDTDIAPQFIGLNIGEASDPANAKKPNEYVLKAGSITQENPVLSADGTTTLFEPNDNRTDATSLNLATSVGEPIVLAAEIEDSTDLDYYKFELQAGRKYSFIVISSDLITGFDSRITLYDSTSNELISPRASSSAYMIEADDSDPNAYDENGENLDPRVIGWTSTYTGEAYLRVEGYAGQSGYYFLIIREHDVIDLPDTAASELSMNRTSLTVNSAEVARISVTVRNKFNEKITNLGANDVEISVGSVTQTAIQDTAEKSLFYIDVNAPASVGSDEITANILPISDTLLKKLTLNYVGPVSLTKSIVKATPQTCFADGYSEVKVILIPKDSSDRTIYDPNLTVSGLASDGVLGLFQFDIETGIYTAKLTAPDSKLKINATVDVSINGSFADDAQITFEGKISHATSSSGGGGGGCGFSGINNQSQSLSLLALFLIIMTLLYVKTRRVIS